MSKSDGYRLMLIYVIRHTDRKSYKYIQCPNVYQCLAQSISIPGVVFTGTEKNENFNSTFFKIGCYEDILNASYRCIK